MSGGTAKAFDASRYERFFERPWLNDEARRFLFDERRIDPRVVRWCRLTSWKDRQGVPWLQTPYYDREGRLVGVQNRNLVKGATPRFRFPSGSQCGIYNLPVLNLLKPGDRLYITEGCSDCWAMLSAGHKAIAIPQPRSSPTATRSNSQFSALSSQLNTTCSPTATSPANGSSYSCRRCCPRSYTINCLRAARTSASIISSRRGEYLTRAHEREAFGDSPNKQKSEF